MKKVIYPLLLTLCFVLTGCSGIRGTIEKQMIEQAGIADDSNYQTYQTYSEEGKLTPQGYYSEDVFESEATVATRPSDTVLISFAKNSYLDVTYFADSNHSIQIGNQADYFKSGDSIFAAVEIANDVSSSMYSFEGFRLYLSLIHI